MEKEKIYELFDFMTSSGKYVFVDDFEGWGDEAKIPSFPSFPSPEGNGIKSAATGRTFEPQCETVRRGNHLEVQYREINGTKVNLVKRVKVGDLFSEGTPVVIITGSEALRRVAPIFNRRSEVIDWLMLIHNYCECRQAKGDPVPWYWEGGMQDLVIYLYQNQPQADKIEDRSIYDRLTDV